MSPGPAPSLVYDWLTPGFVWLAVAVFAAAVAGVFVGKYLLAGRATTPGVEALNEPCGLCDLPRCPDPATHVFDANTTDGLLYICTAHAGAVRAWVG